MSWVQTRGVEPCGQSQKRKWKHEHGVAPMGCETEKQWMERDAQCTCTGHGRCKEMGYRLSPLHGGTAYQCSIGEHDMFLLSIFHFFLFFPIYVLTIKTQNILISISLIIKFCLSDLFIFFCLLFWSCFWLSPFGSQIFDAYMLPL